MEKWNVLSVFLLATGGLMVSGNQLTNMENERGLYVDLTTPLYNFWLVVNLASIAIGFDMLMRLRELSVTVDLSMEHTKKPKRRKAMWKDSKYLGWLYRFFKNVRAAAGPGTVATLAVGLIILAYLLPIGLLALADANTTGLPAVVVTMLQTVLPILVIIGVALKYVPRR